jgi:hypothetical protein
MIDALVPLGNYCLRNHTLDLLDRTKDAFDKEVVIEFMEDHDSVESFFVEKMERASVWGALSVLHTVCPQTSKVAVRDFAYDIGALNGLSDKFPTEDGTPLDKYKWATGILDNGSYEGVLDDAEVSKLVAVLDADKLKPVFAVIMSIMWDY